MFAVIRRFCPFSALVSTIAEHQGPFLKTKKKNQFMSITLVDHGFLIAHPFTCMDGRNLVLPWCKGFDNMWGKGVVDLIWGNACRDGDGIALDGWWDVLGLS